MLWLRAANTKTEISSIQGWDFWSTIYPWRYFSLQNLDTWFGFKPWVKILCNKRLLLWTINIFVLCILHDVTLSLITWTTDTSNFCCMVYKVPVGLAILVGSMYKYSYGFFTINGLVTQLPPLIHNHAILSILGWQTHGQSPSSLSCQKWTPCNVRAVFSKPVYAARVRIGLFDICANYGSLPTSLAVSMCPIPGILSFFLLSQPFLLQ